MSAASYALVLDDAQTRIGEVALRLLRLGIDVLYAVDRDEAWLLARQEAQRVRAVLFAPEVDFEPVLEAFGPESGSERPALVAVGAAPDTATRAQLRERGVQWALFEPYDESALRFVVTAAMAGAPQGTPRRATRLATTLRGRAFLGIHRKDAIVCTLSSRGAFLETPHPHPEGTHVIVEIALPEAPITVEAEVVYAKDADAAGPCDHPNGMGVQFTGLAPACEQRLTAFLEAQHQRFLIG